MAKKPNISTVSTGYQATDTINDNFNNLRNGFENTLSFVALNRMGLKIINPSESI